MSESTATPARRAGASVGHQTSATRHPFTVETGLTIGIVLIALMVRLYRLGLAPLAPQEAQLALAAWRGTLPPAGASPLLTWLSTLLFATFGSSDALARLVPALVGTACVAVPALLRDRIGRVGALGAAVVLAISPVAIMTSRTAGGDALAATVMSGLVAVVVRYLDDRRAGWLYAGAALLGLGLASGSTMVSALVTLALSAGLVVALAPVKARQAWQSIRNAPGLARQALLVLAAVFLGASTACAWKPGGLGSAVESLSAWVSGFSSGATGWVWPVQVLAVYEMLAVVAGVIGLIMAGQRRRQGQRDHFSIYLMAWLVVALVLVIARPARANGDMLLVVIPLALLGGYAAQSLARSFRVVPASREGNLLIVILLPVIAYFVLGLAGYAGTSGSAAVAGAPLNLGPAAQLIQSLLAVALAVVVIALFGALGGTEAALRGTTLAILIALALATWSAGWGAAQVRPGDPRELVAGPETTSLDVRDLTHDLAILSADKTTDVAALSLAVHGPSDGVLGWYLRGLPGARFVSRLEGPDVPSAFITTDAVPVLSGSYAGQRYTLRHAWRLEGQTTNTLLKWLIYRKADIPRPTQQVVLWVKQGQ